ncbi:RNA polymerase II elongation factor Ell isoform X2 [Toxorhynchites rutilus septentrionalis]|uniref:RNA polymerase II elongation factor Ell isoform X2 n=1 Tax=Toxorhynchites rutilus septentrionalis TaxID=329112 RepID=UPI00247B0D1B|nr:RNA polymerase II elongation factor Ell isoform X2 [Toxorhynchites rutilus septentrionalis]
MAALCAGSYGLSQQQPQYPNNDNKELIFVKLTDSALRAIEEFQRNQLKLNTGLNPSIQFLANGQGYLSFPSSGNNVQKFSFSITDIEGGGSIECVQQNQGQQLQNMGHIPHKMRIQANDDVYETTRHRMAAAEENQKNKCTREIKPNQTDIGRKVKLKNPTGRISNIPSNNTVLSKRDSLHGSNHNSYNGSSNNNNNNNNNSSSNNGNAVNSSNNHSSSVPVLASNHNHHHNNNISNNSYSNHSTSPKLPKSNGLQHNNHHHNNALPTLQQHQQQQQQQHQQQQQQQQHQPSKPGYQHTVHDPPQQQQPQQRPEQSQQKSENGVTSGRVTNGRTQHSKPGNPEIMKRNIRERLIHLLALRPYKKPELYARIQQDGLRGQEKICIAQVLKTISSMRDNVYYLHRHIWNDVQEDWPFYTEQDRQTLKRRKPQNLTPPLSSDGGSSTSGQSPSSAHNGSSPPSGSKRPSLPTNEESSIGSAPTSKKPRISHYKKDVLPDTNRSIRKSETKSQNPKYPLSRRGVTDSRDTSNMNPRSRPQEDSMRSYHHGSNVTPSAQESEDSGVSLSYSLVSNDVARRIQPPTTAAEVVTDAMTERDNYDDQITAYREDSKKVKNLKDDFSDQFTRITTVEQRRKYKTEFDNDFQEYRRLHEIVERVSRKFAQLEEDLQMERHNERRYKEIQRKIIREYDESIKDIRFQETKQRFNYLHSKLSHIKHLVHDYDVAITNGLCRPQENY